MEDNSPCVNTGINEFTYADDLDLNGNIRINYIVDIGCFENQRVVSYSCKIKEDGSWVDITRIFKKIDGIWVEQSQSQWENLFDANIKYIYKKV